MEKAFPLFVVFQVGSSNKPGVSGSETRFAGIHRDQEDAIKHADMLKYETLTHKSHGYYIVYPMYPSAFDALQRAIRSVEEDAVEMSSHFDWLDSREFLS